MSILYMIWSDAAKCEALKGTIKIIIIPLGWIQVKHEWSCQGVNHSINEYADHLKRIIGEKFFGTPRVATYINSILEISYCMWNKNCGF